MRLDVASPLMLIYAAIGAFGFLFLIVLLFAGGDVGDHDAGDHDLSHRRRRSRRARASSAPASWRRFSRRSASAASSAATTTCRTRRPPASASCAGIVMAGLVYQFAKLLYSQQASSEMRMTHAGRPHRRGVRRHSRRRCGPGDADRRRRAHRAHRARGAAPRRVPRGAEVVITGLRGDSVVVAPAGAPAPGGTR